MLHIDTKVVVNGFGDSEYPDNPTYQEITTLGNSLNVIKEHLHSQTEYPINGFIFSVNLFENAEYIYSYLNEKIRVSGKYEDEETLTALFQNIFIRS